MLSFEQFIDLVDKNYNDRPFELRYGQTVMNVLQSVWNEKYKELSGGYNDCFYDDGIVRFTLDRLQMDWPRE